MTHTNKIHEAGKLLSQLLGTELAEIIELVSAEPGTIDSYIISIPADGSIDNDVAEMRSLVARTSNMYGRVARLAGMARAQFKLAEQRYKYKYRSSLLGANKEAREANAARASEDEAIEFAIIGAFVELVDKAEASTRVSSETARKMLGNMENMYQANNREAKGFYKQDDFKDFY